MKPFAIQIGKRIILIAGSPKNMGEVTIAKSPRANLVLVKVELDS